MNEQEIKKAFEKLNPSEKQKEKMWEQINSNKRIKKSNVIYRFMRDMATVAAIMVTVLLSGMVINAATGGKIISTIQKVFEHEDEETTKKKDDIVLPEFEYTGEDMAIKSIVEYFREYDKIYHTPRKGCVWVPAYVIYERVETEDEVMILGFFWAYTYKLNGDVFEVDGGHGTPARFQLKKVESEYEIIEADLPPDGTGYTESVKAFTEGYPEVYDLIISNNKEEDKRLRIEYRRMFLQMYINKNDLAVKYYKDFGQEAIEIFAQ